MRSEILFLLFGNGGRKLRHTFGNVAELRIELFEVAEQIKCAVGVTGLRQDFGHVVPQIARPRPPVLKRIQRLAIPINRAIELGLFPTAQP